MCNDKKLFVDLRHLNTPQQVTLGDGSSLEGPAEGTVTTENTPTRWKHAELQTEKYSFILKLAYTLLSVSKAFETGKTTKFIKSGCKILNKEKKIVFSATRVGNLYHLRLLQEGAKC